MLVSLLFIAKCRSISEKEFRDYKMKVEILEQHVYNQDVGRVLQEELASLKESTKMHEQELEELSLRKY
jgi:hypothetical protein